MKTKKTLKWSDVSESAKIFAIVGIISLVAASTLIFVVFALRTLIDPMYRNADLIKITKHIFYVFLWPYYLIESVTGGVNPDGSHNFHFFWTPLGLLFSLAYIVGCGNVIYAIINFFKRR